MKGYFSQLARHTGLRFPNAAHATSTHSHAADSRTHSNVQSVASPLHVEEVTFVPPTTTVNAPSTSTEQTPPALVPENAPTAETRNTTPNTQPAQTTPTTQTDTERSFPEPFAIHLHESSLANDTGRGSASQAGDQNFRALATEHQSPSLERNAERDPISTRPADYDLQLERVVAVAAPEQDHQTQTEPPSPPVNDLNPSDPVQREVLVRQYLREVRAWVAAPPTPIPDVPENQIAEEHATTEWQPERVTTHTPNRAPLNTSPQPDHIDVHETSLSIGSINIVIEDPKPNVMTIAPAPAPPAAQPQPQPEPTSLSRYYLQRW